MLISDDQVRAAVSGREAIGLIREAFRTHYPQAIVPERVHMEVPGRGVLLLMPCGLPSLDAMGIKSAMILDRAVAAGESVQGTYLLLSARTGQFRATLEARHLTALRTAAASAVATDLLARPDATSLGIFGTGRLARSHAELLREVRAIEEVLLCGTSEEKSRALAQELSSIGLRARAASAEECAAADIVCTCTNATEPVLRGEWLRPGAHLNLIGAFRPQTREVDQQAVARSSVFVDTFEGALSEAGDLLQPMRDGRIGREHLLADLHALITGAHPGRRSPQEITLFKSVGHAIEDLVIADAVAARTLAR